jgi:hypothetical protein
MAPRLTEGQRRSWFSGNDVVILVVMVGWQEKEVPLAEAGSLRVEI